MRARAAGLTLIELLVTMALSLTILGAVMSWQSSSMGLSSALDERSGQLSTVGDLSGYLGSRMREAAAFPDGLTLGGSKCQLSGTLPCLAAILPVVNTGAGGDARITGWQLHAYRYVRRSDVGADSKTVNAWLDGNALALREERYAGSCPGTAVPAASCFAGAAATTPLLLADNLTLSQTGGSFQAFEMGTGGRSVTLRLRVVGARRGKVTTTPGDGPHRLMVGAHNVAP